MTWKQRTVSRRIAAIGGRINGRNRRLYTRVAVTVSMEMRSMRTLRSTYLLKKTPLKIYSTYSRQSLASMTLKRKRTKLIHSIGKLKRSSESAYLSGGY
jgi:hypothetical protein